VIDQSRAVGDILFATHADRASYLGTLNRLRPRWLQENKDCWQRIRDVRQEASPLRPVVESKIDVGGVASIENEIEVGGRRYVGAQRLAALLGVSLRTLSRWDATGTGPPKIKVGRKVVFDLGKIPQWLASREIPPTRITGRN